MRTFTTAAITRLLAATLVLAIPTSLQPLRVYAAARQNVGQISGKAVVEGKPLPNVTVRLRNVDTGQVTGEMTSNSLGEFNFTGLPGGNYVVETVAPKTGAVVSTSARISLTPGSMTASGLTVSTSAAAAASAGLTTGAVGAGAAAGAAAGGTAFFATTAGIITAVAIAGGVTAVIIAANNDASASR